MKLLLLLIPLTLSAAQQPKRPGTPRPIKESPHKPQPPKDTKEKHKEAKKKNLHVVMEGNYTFRKLEY